MPRLAWLVIPWLFCSVPLYAQGRLEKARLDTVYHPDPPAANPPTNSAPRNDNGPNVGVGQGLGPDSGEGLGYLIGLGVLGATSPFWLPSLLLDDSLSNPGYFPHRPFAGDDNGYMHIGKGGFEPVMPEYLSFGDPEFLKPWAVRVSVENGNDFGGLNRLNGRVFFDTLWRVGLWTNWTYLHENVDGRSDEALLGDTNRTFRIAQGEHVLVHAGAGFRMLNDHTGSRFGFNLLYSVDLFVRPLVLSSQFDAGMLDSAWVLHGRATVGYVHRSWEVFTGYDFLRIGTVNIQGPLAGVRFWF